MSYRGVSGWRAGAAAGAPLPGGGETAAAAFQAAAATADGVLCGAARQPVAGAGAAADAGGAVGVGRLAGAAAVGLLQAAAAAGRGLVQAQEGEVSRQVALAHRLAAAEREAGGRHGGRGAVGGSAGHGRRGGEVARLRGGRVAVARVAGAAAQARAAIGLDGRAAEALATAPPKQVGAGDRTAPLGLRRRAVVARAA